MKEMELFHLLPKLSPLQIKKKIVSKRYKLVLPLSYLYKINENLGPQNQYAYENIPFSLKKGSVEAKNNGNLITQILFIIKNLINLA